MLYKPSNVQIFILQICSTMPIQDINTSAPIYWRWHVISANTYGANKKGDALQNSHRFPYSSRHRLLIKLEQAETERRSFTRNYTFELKITLDRHSPRQKLNNCFLPDLPNFSLPSTFKAYFMFWPFLTFHSLKAHWYPHWLLVQLRLSFCKLVKKKK